MEKHKGLVQKQSIIQNILLWSKRGINTRAQEIIKELKAWTWEQDRKIQFRNSKIIQPRKGEIDPTKTAGKRKRGICVHYWKHRWCIESSEMLCSLIIECKDWKGERISVQQESLLHSSSGYATFTHHWERKVLKMLKRRIFQREAKQVIRR